MAFVTAGPSMLKLHLSHPREAFLAMWRHSSSILWPQRLSSCYWCGNKLAAVSTMYPGPFQENTRRIRKWFTDSSSVLSTSQVVYQRISHRNLWSIADWPIRARALICLSYKSQYVRHAGAKRGKICASETRLVICFTCQWMKNLRDFISQHLEAVI